MFITYALYNGNIFDVINGKMNTVISALYNEKKSAYSAWQPRRAKIKYRASNKHGRKINSVKKTVIALAEFEFNDLQNTSIIFNTPENLPFPLIEVKDEKEDGKFSREYVYQEVTPFTILLYSGKQVSGELACDMGSKEVTYNNIPIHSLLELVVLVGKE